METFVEIINSAKVRSNSNLVISGIQANKNGWNPFMFYPNNGVVGVLIGEAQSYEGTESTGTVKLIKDLECDISGRDVVIVEDIVDTGRTLLALKNELLSRNPTSLTFVTMLDKPSRRVVDFKADYVGKTIDNLFVFGFGLDYNQKYRNLKDIYVMD
jgi:hypoxanthine phosphoribosyltransferase